MTRQAELRAQATGKRSMATLARRTGLGLSLVEDRKMMQEHVRQLEADATRLEAQANALDAPDVEPSTQTGIADSRHRRANGSGSV